MSARLNFAIAYPNRGPAISVEANAGTASVMPEPKQAMFARGMKT